MTNHLNEKDLTALSETELRLIREKVYRQMADSAFAAISVAKVHEQ